MTNGKIKLLLEMIEFSWQGNPEAVSDKHWNAFQEVAAEVGYEVAE